MDNRKEELKNIMRRYSANSPIFVHKLKDNDSVIETNMKESLNRIGDNDESESKGSNGSETTGDI